MDQNDLLAVLRRICALYAEDRRACPEIELVLDAYEGGGSCSVDLYTRAQQLGVEPRRLRRRLERLAPFGVIYMPAAGGQLAQLTLSPRGGAGGGAGAGAAPRRGRGARPQDADGGTRAAGSGSVLTGSFFGSVRAGIARVPLLAFTPEEEPARIDRAREVLAKIGCQIPAAELPAVAAAVYSAEDYLGGPEMFDQVYNAAIANGPDLPSGWQGWANHIRRHPVDYLTRLTFVGSSKPYRDTGQEIVDKSQLGAPARLSWAERCEAHPELAQFEQALILGRGALEDEAVRGAWLHPCPITVLPAPSDRVQGVILISYPSPYYREWIKAEYWEELSDAAEVIGLTIKEVPNE